MSIPMSDRMARWLVFAPKSWSDIPLNLTTLLEQLVRCRHPFPVKGRQSAKTQMFLFLKRSERQGRAQNAARIQRQGDVF